MLDTSKAYSGFAVTDIDEDEAVLRGDTSDSRSPTSTWERRSRFWSFVWSDRHVLIYPKPDLAAGELHDPQLPGRATSRRRSTSSAAKGVSFERYDGFDQDEKGIDREGPAGGIAWFKDPAGNILAVHGASSPPAAGPATLRGRHAINT